MSDRENRDEDGEPEIDFPELRQAVLDRETLARYFRDLREATEILGVRVKGAAQEQTDGRDVGLKRARELLETQAVLGMQVRYRWRGALWWDTLIRKSGGIELTRVQPPGPEEV